MRGNSASGKPAAADAQVEALDGKLGSNPDEQRLMRSVLEHDDTAVEDGKLLAEAINQGIGVFTPELLFQNLVQNFHAAKRLYGETLIQAATDYSADYIRRNLSIPEFRDALQQRIEERLDSLKKGNLLDKSGNVTDRGYLLAAVILYVEQLEQLESKGLGREEINEPDSYGEPEKLVTFQRQSYRDVALRPSIRLALRRGHAELLREDLKAVARSHKGRIQIIYALDASGSMRGEKIGLSKRAGIGLAFRAIEERNEVGLMVFTSKVEQVVPPTLSFPRLLVELARARAGRETDIAATVLESTRLFTSARCTKHLIILTDAVPTQGEDPWQSTLEATARARAAGITISIIGINLDAQGERLAREVVELGKGRLYRVADLSHLDAVMLQEYDAVAKV